MTNTFISNSLLLWVSLLVATGNCLAQSTEPISTDRPDQSDGTYTLTKRHVQLENGITIAEGTFLNNLMVRYGITATTEVRILLDAGRFEGKKGLLPVTIGVKQRLMEQQAIKPAVTFVGYVGSERLSSRDFYGKGIPVELKLAFENELSDVFAVGYNIGTSDWFNNLNLSCGVSCAPISKFSLFVEYFSTLEKSNADHNLDAGILFAVNPNCQLDIAGGRSIFDADNRLFFTAGFAYRINKFPQKQKRYIPM